MNTAGPFGMRSGEGPLISVVVPAFNEAENLRPLIARLSQELGRYPSFEILIVDDGSSDGSLEILRELAAAHPALRYLSFSRNFGHQTALRAGLEHAAGDCVISMDADFQHPPELLHAMIARWEAGAELVVTRRADDVRIGLFKRATSAAFYRLLSAIGDAPLEPGSADFRLLDRRVVEALRQFVESELFLRGIVPLLGFRREVIDYVPADRLHGTSKYSFARMLRLAVAGVLTTSLRPLRLAMLLSVAVGGLAVAYALYAAFIFLFLGTAIPGWASVVVVVAVLGSMQLFVLGIIGEYLGQVLREARRRPHYIVREAHVVPVGPRAPLPGCGSPRAEETVAG